jgi:hypothetical protein
MNRLDLKALRIGLHGWWLGNPLVYKPGAADLVGIARELASAGAASGTLVLSNTADVATMSDERVEAILILRPPIARTLSGESVARSIAAVIETTFERPYLIQEGQGQWDVVTGAGSPPADVCHVHVDAAGQNDVVFLGLRLDLGRLWMTAQRLERDGGQPVALLARPDWREVLLARILHALDVSLAV